MLGNLEKTGLSDVMVSYGGIQVIGLSFVGGKGVPVIGHARRHSYSKIPDLDLREWVDPVTNCFPTASPSVIMFYGFLMGAVTRHVFSFATFSSQVTHFYICHFGSVFFFSF